MDDRQMNYEDYSAKAHHAILCTWWKEWDIEPVPQEFLPLTGVFVPNIACGFLYSTDSSVCILDGYISNPLADKIERAQALDIITYVLLEKAQTLKFKLIKADSCFESIKGRALKNGFNYLGEFSSFAKEL